MLTIDQRIELSKAMGAPVDGLHEKAEVVLPIIEAVLRAICETPREATVMLAIAHLYFTDKFSTTKENPIDRAQEMLECVASVLIHTKE